MITRVSVLFSLPAPSTAGTRSPVDGSMVRDEFLGVEQGPEDVAQPLGGIAGVGEVFASDLGLVLIGQSAERAEVGFADDLCRVGGHGLGLGGGFGRVVALLGLPQLPADFPALVL